MLENVTVNNYNPSRRSMGRYLTEVKVASALDGGFSITDKVINKTMVRYTSENSIRNVLSCAVAVLSTHFVIGEELDSKIFDSLSEDAKKTIELTKKLNNNENVMPIHPDQACSNG